MRARKRFRLPAAAAALAAATLAFGANAQAATEGDTSTFAAVEGPGAMSCSLDADFNTGTWTCETPTPIVAGGLDCIQSAHVDVDGRSVTVPLTGCTASLLIPSAGWQGVSNCNRGYPVGAGCQGALADGFAYFSFQPVLGSPMFEELAVISDAECTGDGGRATVESSGFFDGANAFSMDGTITWTGGCTSVSLLTWAGTVTVG